MKLIELRARQYFQSHGIVAKSSCTETHVSVGANGRRTYLKRLRSSFRAAGVAQYAFLHDAKKSAKAAHIPTLARFVTYAETPASGPVALVDARGHGPLPERAYPAKDELARQFAEDACMLFEHLHALSLPHGHLRRESFELFDDHRWVLVDPPIGHTMLATDSSSRSRAFRRDGRGIARIVLHLLTGSDPGSDPGALAAVARASTSPSWRGFFDLATGAVTVDAKEIVGRLRDAVPLPPPEDECVITSLVRELASDPLPPPSSVLRRTLGVPRERFGRQLRALSSLGSPHVVTVYDAGQLDDGSPYLAMESLAHLPTLAAASASFHRLEHVVRVARALAASIAVVHARGLVVRTLSPKTLYLEADADGVHVKISDLGMVSGEDTPRLSDDFTLIGSPPYMAPEQIRSPADVDHRADLWAFGAIVYELVAGKPPFDDADPMATLRKVVDDELPSLEIERSPGLASLIERCLSKKRDLRPASIAEVAVSLRRIDAALSSARA